MKKILKYILITLLFLPNIIFAEEVPEISSKNAIMINLNDNSVIYEKNSNEKTLIASMTKIMTSIVAIENIDNLEEKVILTEDIFNNLDKDLSMAGFKANEEVTYNDLLYGALLPSGGDATHALAVFISGSEENFVSLMNKKASELNLKNTHFTNTVGIESKDNMHYSTVEDVSNILKYALNNKTFKKIFKSNIYKTSDGVLVFKSTKKSIEKKYEKDFSFILGSKTGYTSKAGLCLASIASKNKVNYLLVTAGADKQDGFINHFLDAEKLYNYFFENYSYKTIVKKNKLIKKIKTKYQEEVLLKSKKEVRKYIKNDISINDLEYKYIGKEVLNKSIKKNDEIGRFDVYLKDVKLYSEKVYSPITVKFKLTKSQEILLSVLILIILSIYICKKYLRLK